MKWWAMGAPPPPLFLNKFLLHPKIAVKSDNNNGISGMIIAEEAFLLCLNGHYSC